MAYPKTPAEFIARAVAALEAGFKTMTAKKDAMADLGRAYEMHRKTISTMCLDAKGPDREGQMTEEQSELYYAIPYDLHNYRAKHTAQAVKVFPELAPVCAEIEKLVEMRKEFNAAPVAPKEPTKTQREESIRLSATGKLYQDEFGKLAPLLEQDYTRYIEARFEALHKAYGDEMVKVLGAHYRHGKLPEGVHAHDIKTFNGLLWRYFTTEALKGNADPALDRAKVKRDAEDYAEAQIKQFVVKLTQKLGDLTEVTIRDVNRSGFEFEIDGMLRGHKVRVKQSRKFVVNQQDTAFHQWPALIYVDGKFTTEAAFKRLSAGG